MDKNLETYNRKDVVNWYSRLTDLLHVEKAFFERKSETLKTGKILDIGVGGGRTTAYLFQHCKSYTGIDYSENFVKILRMRFPATDIRHMDVRNLSAFPDNSFDLVNFSFNGIDYIDLAGRNRSLKEIWRVLKPGTTFFFSTHNKDHSSFGKPPWLSTQNSFLINLKTFLKLLPFLPKNLKTRKLETITEEYAIINDSAHNYGLLTFYTSIKYLKKQLHDAGFHDIVMYTKDGCLVGSENPAEDWIFIECSKL
ncbi:MAG: class I SAM-dependent methyltransferase [Bacteroidia bacterium]|nr:class I SAM-dependent methyltransferase [Bacteroidia bacterium]